ncbi:MAG: ATP-binding protein [Chloroflexota bacterium]
MRFGLQGRLFSLVMAAMVLMLLSLGIFGTLSVKERVDDILQQQLRLAETTAGHVQYVLQDALENLNEVGLTLASGQYTDSELKGMVHDLYLQTPFSGGILLLDESGRLVLSEPSRPNLPPDMTGYSHIREAIATRRPVVSGYYRLEPTGEPLVSVAMPWARGGRLGGMVVGNIDLTSPSFQSAIQLPTLGSSGEYADLVDSRGVIIASTKRERVLQESKQGEEFAALIARQETERRIVEGAASSGAEIVAFFPLSRFVFLVPWGVAVRQLESEALVPAQTLQRQFYLVGISILVVGLIFTWGLARSIVRPVVQLTDSARKIAAGRFNDPVPVPGEGELGELARNFDIMRQQLRASLERIQQWNWELEQTVRERTRELEEAHAMEGELLHRVITAQEDERRRIARELHDETSQALTALVVSLDTASMTVNLDEKLKSRLAFMKSVTVGLLDSVRQMIYDLRPALLDDLGLVPALKWYAEQRLKPLGVRVRVESSGSDQRLPPQVETSLFRVVQEAITNIAKHAEAENVVLSIECGTSEVAVDVEDDGKGFDPLEVAKPSEKGQGLGLLGMKERVSLLNGKFSIDSRPGGGTAIKVRVPVTGGTDPG